MTESMTEHNQTVSADGRPEGTEGTTNQARRRFLAGIGGVALAGGAVALAPDLFLIAPSPAEARSPAIPASPQNRWGLLIDVSQCNEGCTACVDACREEMGWDGHGRPTTDPQWIRKVELENPETGAKASLPVMCQHCASPPCVDVCPTGASFKRVDGIVLVDRHICIGCRYCMMACPYKARSFVHEELEDQKPYMPRGMGCVESCTLCVHRVDAGRDPACVEACSAKGGGAMTFGDLKDAKSALAQAVKARKTTQIRDDFNLNPGVHYLNL